MQTLKKLKQVNGAMSMTLDKLPAICEDLVRVDPDWEKWDFAQLSEAVRLDKKKPGRHEGNGKRDIRAT